MDDVDTSDGTEYCDYCEEEGHSFRSCPARDDDQSGDYEEEDE